MFIKQITHAREVEMELKDRQLEEVRKALMNAKTQAMEMSNKLAGLQANMTKREIAEQKKTFLSRRSLVMLQGLITAVSRSMKHESSFRMGYLRKTNQDPYLAMRGCVEMVCV